MRNIKFILLFIFNLVIDLNILSRYNLYGYIPSITIPLIIILSTYNDKESIVYYSIFQGIFQDVAFHSVLGVKALTFYLIAYYTFKFDYNKNLSLIYIYVSLIMSILLKNLIFTLTDVINIKTSFSEFLLYKLKVFPIEVIISLVIISILYLISYNLRKTRVKEYI